MKAYQKILKLTVLLGASLMKNGAEVYRVEEAIKRVLFSYGIKDPEVFAIPNMLIVTIETENEEALTRTYRIYNHSTNFEKINQLNELSRKLAREAIPLDEAYSLLDEINNTRGYSQSVHFISYGLIAFSFTLMFQGTVFDAIIAAIAVYIGRVVCNQMEKFSTNNFFVTLTASFIHSFVAILSLQFFPDINLDEIIIGTLMVLVPGVAFMTAVRDVIARDFIAGMIEGLEVVVVACAIAIGSALALTILPILWRFI